MTTITWYSRHFLFHFLKCPLFRVPGDTKVAILKQCLKTEAHSGLSEVADIIVMRVSFMWLFWGSLLGLTFLVMLTISFWDFCYSLLDKVHGNSTRSILNKCWEIEAESYLSRVAGLFIPRVYLMLLFWGSLFYFNT